MPKEVKQTPKLVSQPAGFPNEYRDNIQRWPNVPPSEAAKRFVEKRDLNTIYTSPTCDHK